MGSQRGQSEKEARRKEKRDAEHAGRLAKEQERRKAYFAKEQAAQEASDKKQSERAEKRVTEGAEELAREQARKKAHSAREKDLAEAQEARRLREKKGPPTQPADTASVVEGPASVEDSRPIT